ncbi:MAG: hypothetical protein LVR00_06555 [Rhabdochlamydiaceae bacterium]|jgi:hypothetical protein
MLLLSDGKTTLSSSGKLFLQKILLEELLGRKSDLLPPECLPELFLECSFTLATF